MGWFLKPKSKKKKAGRKSTAKKKASGGPWYESQGFVISMRVGMWMLLVVGVLGGWYYGESKLQSWIGEKRERQPVVRLVNLPDWVKGELAESIQYLAEAQLKGDPFDAESLRRVAFDLRANPWVEDVRSVRRHSSGVVEIDAAYREPVLMVQVKKGGVYEYHLIDKRGVHLPLVIDAKSAEEIGLPAVTGVAGAPPRYGEMWVGSDVQAALSLSELVSVQSWADQIKAIDVSNHEGRRWRDEGYLKLITKRDWNGDPRDNPGIVWGRAPGKEKGLELSTETKLGLIAVMARKHGGDIDGEGMIVPVYSLPFRVRRAG